MKVESPPHSLAIQELDDLVLKILLRNPFGLPASRIAKALPPAYRKVGRQLPAYLEALLLKGLVNSWQPPPGKTKSQPAPIYSIEPLSLVVSNHVVESLSLKALTPADIKTLFPSHIKTHFVVFFEPLLKDQTVKWHPPLGRKRLLSLKDPDPRDFLAPEIKRLFEKGRRLGFPDAAISQAVQGQPKPESDKLLPPLSMREIESVVFKAMGALKPSASQGALVYIPDLRQALLKTFPDKDTFDRAILELAKFERVQLQSHSLPDMLTEEQKMAMIDNRRGSYFMALGIRME